jgi:hypothetical protein
VAWFTLGEVYRAAGKSGQGSSASAHAAYAYRRAIDLSPDSAEGTLAASYIKAYGFN